MGSKEGSELDTLIGSIFIILLSISFIVLKLCGVIEWRWVWVLCPIWINPAVTGAGVVLSFFYHLFKELLRKRKQ